MINLDGSRSLALQTSKGNDVPNVQDLEVPLYRRQQPEALIRQQLGLDFTRVTRRREATATYNCHGMSFACRRTGIHDVAAVQLILSDDGDKEVHEKDVLPGDVALYFVSGTGELIHSGLVVAVERQNSIVLPQILSHAVQELRRQLAA
jgi:hypothetical protein